MDPLFWLWFVARVVRGAPAKALDAQQPAPFVRRNAAGTVTQAGGGFVFEAADGSVRFRFFVRDDAPSMKPAQAIQITQMERGTRGQASAIGNSPAFKRLVADILPARA